MKKGKLIAVAGAKTGDNKTDDFRATYECPYCKRIQNAQVEAFDDPAVVVKCDGCGKELKL